MKQISQTSLALLTWFLLLPALASSAQGVADEVDALRGLAGVYVMGGDPGDVLGGHGVVKEDVLIAVTSRLRKGGVPVLDETEWLMEESAPVLFIDFGWNVQDDLVVYSVRLEVLYLVIPIAGAEITTYAVIWGEGRVGTLGDSASDRIISELQELADKLASDYSKSNS